MDKFSGRTTVGNRVREGQRILNEDLVQKCLFIRRMKVRYNYTARRMGKIKMTHNTNVY